jgi:hypothetical protein
VLFGSTAVTGADVPARVYVTIGDGYIRTHITGHMPKNRFMSMEIKKAILQHESLDQTLAGILRDAAVLADAWRNVSNR